MHTSLFHHDKNNGHSLRRFSDVGLTATREKMVQHEIGVT